VLAEVQLRLLPLVANPALQFFHCLWVMSVHAALEVTPQILDR
jgi:hypothetical protein